MLHHSTPHIAIVVAAMSRCNYCCGVRPGLSHSSLLIVSAGRRRTGRGDDSAARPPLTGDTLTAHQSTARGKYGRPEPAPPRLDTATLHPRPDFHSLSFLPDSHCYAVHPSSPHNASHRLQLNHAILLLWLHLNLPTPFHQLNNPVTTLFSAIIVVPPAGLVYDSYCRCRSCRRDVSSPPSVSRRVDRMPSRLARYQITVSDSASVSAGPAAAADADQNSSCRPARPDWMMHIRIRSVPRD